MDALTILALTASICLLALTGLGTWIGVRWVHSRLPRPGEGEGGFRRRRPPSGDEDSDIETEAADFVQGVDGMNAWALGEWARQRIEDDEWTEEDVVQFLETREPIELT